ncbi:MAG: hypothetical protein ACRD01_09655 [Terriglobales bacterium]
MPQPRRKLASFIWWSYPRGSIEYDIMVGVILAFIFLTPRHLFRDQPRPTPPPVAMHAAHLEAPFEVTWLGASARGAFAVPSGRALPSGEFRPQPDPRGPQRAGVLGWQREGVQNMAAAPLRTPGAR